MLGGACRETAEETVLAGQGAGVIYGASGEGRASLVDARDVAAVAAAALTEAGHEGQTYMVTGPEALAKADVARIISKVTGRQVRYVNVSPEVMAENHHHLGWPHRWADELVAVEDLRVANRLATVTDVVERLTGKKQATALCVTQRGDRDRYVSRLRSSDTGCRRCGRRSGNGWLHTALESRR